MPRLRGLLDPRADEEGAARDRRRAREHRVRLRHRLLQPVPVLPEHLRRARHPRPRSRHRDGPEDGAPGPPGVGHHRRRRRPQHRRKPPDARDAAQHRHQDPAVQQPHLRTDQGPVLANVPARARHPQHPLRLGGRTASSAVDRTRQRGDIRGALGGHAHEAPRCGAAPGRRAPRHRLRRDLPELQRLQRRGRSGTRRT